MRGKKWTVTAGIVVLMFVGAVVSTLWARRSVQGEQARVRAAVARAYPQAAAVKVASCRVLPGANPNAANPRARYECTVVASGCRQTRRFAVPTESDGTPANAVGVPLGPPSPRSCA